MTKIEVLEQIELKIIEELGDFESEYITIDGTLVKINNYFNNSEMRRETSDQIK